VVKPHPAKEALCYLCGKPLEPPTNADHVPMKQLWTPDIRKIHSPVLKTLKVHNQCNSDYQLDEEYFVASILPMAKGSYAGDSHYRKLENDVRAKKKIPLKQMVHQEFDFRPGGIFLPSGKVTKHFDRERIDRVVWKIVRGLHFIHHSEILPAKWRIVRDIFIDQPPDHFRWFMLQPDNPERGNYPGVFSYRFKQVTEQEKMQYWAMLFLDRIIITAFFHHPSCDCESCSEIRSGQV